MDGKKKTDYVTRNGVTYRYVEVWDHDSLPEPRLYLYSMPGGLNYPHYCVDIETVKEFKAGGEYSVVAWKHMREIEEPKAEPEPEIDWKARAEKAEKNFWFDLANVCIKAVNDLEYQAEIGEELVTIPRHVWDKSMAEIIEPKEAQA